MYKEVLSEIKDISVYPLFSFIMFFVFFTLTAFWVIRTKNKDFENISRIPLNDEDKYKEYDSK